MMNHPIVLTVALLAASGSSSSLAAEAKRPNVLFILTDDQRWDALGLGGSKHLRTPNIDRIGNEGVYFKNAFCTTSLCSPSRASILSGLYAHAHGVANNFTEYPANLKSFPMVLQSAGYDTAYVGKWHMGEDNDEPRPGFNWFVTHKGQGKYFGTEFNINGSRRETPKGYYTHVVTDMAIEWLNRPRGDKPWLLMIGHKAPHSFYFPEPKYEHAFDGVRVPYPETAFMLDDKPAWIKQRLYTWHGIYGPLFEWRKKFPDDSPEAVKDFEAMTRAYWGTIVSVDDSVGRLYELLKSRGELDNTIIVFMSDNGFSIEDYHIRGKNHKSGLPEGTNYGANGGGGNAEKWRGNKGTFFEGGIRVPAIISWPAQLPMGAVRGQAVTADDWFPTILELCNVPLPKVKLDGQSILPLIKSAEAPTHHQVLHWQWQWFWAVREGDWKLLGRAEKPSHLGNLGDPEPERKNYMNDRPDIVKRLQAMHDEWLKEVEREFYESHPHSQRMY